MILLITLICLWFVIMIGYLARDARHARGTEAEIKRISRETDEIYARIMKILEKP